MLCLALGAITAPWVQAQPAHPLSESTTGGRFALGLALTESGKPRAAAVVFAAILSDNPDLVRVRLELARAYFLSRQWGRARTEFLSVLSGEIPDPVRGNVLRFLREIDARRGFEWNADFSIVELGDTRDYESDTILIDFGGTSLPFTLDGRDGETAYGLRYALSTALNRNIPDLSSQSIRILGFGRITVAGEEGPNRRFDDMTLSGEAGARLARTQSTLTLAPSLSRRFLAGSAWEDRRGWRTTFQKRNRKGAAFTARASWQRVDRLGSENSDGHVSRFSFTASRPFTPRVTLGASVVIKDRDAVSGANDFRRTRLTGFGAFDAGRGITLRPSLWLEQSKFDSTGPAVANETAKGAALRVENSRIILGNGFTPYARVAFTRVKSDLKAFSYREANTSIGLERRF